MSYEWPYPEMWWVLCGAHELDATMFGPFASREAAEMDAKAVEGSCKHAHFAVKGTPPLPPTVPLLPSFPLGLPLDEIHAMEHWLRQNVGTRADCLAPLHAMKERWLNAPPPARLGTEVPF